MINFDNNIFKLGLNTVPYKWKNFIILCSSGVDSIAASHFFINKINTHNYKQNNVGLMHSVATLHFNHNLRPQNNVMAESYRDFCRSIRTYPIVDNLNCADSTENQSRKQRLKILNEHNNTIFISAHHLDDCVESYLLNVLRGKEGFIPIPFMTKLDNLSSCVIHPFLFTRKTDFIKYAEKNDLMKYVVEDETNKQVKGSRRNLMRNKIIPILNEEKMGLQKIVKKKLKERLMLELINI
jgi:tRNA(Ile)-lysidine synthase TilS/MesJ